MPFGLWAQMGPKNHVLDGGPDPTMERGNFGEKGAPIVKYRDTLQSPVWKLLNQSSCHLDCDLEIAQGLSAVSCAETSEPIDLPFRLWTWVGRRKHKFNHMPQVAQMCPHGRAHCCHLVNTIEPRICSNDAVLCQITLTTCLNLQTSNYWMNFAAN